MSFSTGIVGEGKEMRGEVPSSVVCESEGEERKATSSLLYFSRDLATPHFSKFCGQNFKLQLLTHFLMDFLKT